MGCCPSAAVSGDSLAPDAIFYVRDDHASTFQQVRLARDLHKAAGGTLWLEFIYEDVLEEVRKAFASSSTEDDDEALAAVLRSIEHNGWSVEFNESLVNLLSVARKYRMNFHALDDPEWSKDAFIAKYGSTLGGMRYLETWLNLEADLLSSGSKELFLLQHCPAPSRAFATKGGKGLRQARREARKKAPTQAR